MGILFDWDDAKEETNKKKHGIDFHEAITVFSDEHHQIYYDDINSDEEDRFNLIGYSEKRKLLMVCHCHRNGDKITRIISARKATKQENKLYGGSI